MSHTGAASAAALAGGGGGGAGGGKGGGKGQGEASDEEDGVNRGSADELCACGLTGYMRNVCALLCSEVGEWCSVLQCVAVCCSGL